MNRVRFVRTRAAWSARRVAWHAISRAVPAPATERPVFVIGCPRSGTTLLFAILHRHPELAGLGTEGHVFWDAHQHPARKGWGSDRSTRATIRRDEPRFLGTAIRRHTRGRRFLDKTPKNAVRVPYLDALFPDATFVFLRRDGRATVSSLIDGWRARHGVSYRLPVRLELGAYRSRYWNYLLPSGWRSMIRTSIPEVAAFQYRVANDTALGDLELLDPSRVVHLSFEELVASPEATVLRLLDLLELEPAERVLSFARTIDRHVVSTITPPRADKWRDNSEELASVMGAIEPTMRRLGYHELEVGA